MKTSYSADTQLQLGSILAAQRGVISRSQALDAGMNVDALDWRIRRGGPWQRLLPAIYATFTGPVTDAHRWQAALLYGGTGTLLTGLPALVLFELARPVSAAATPILIPHARRRRSVPGVIALRSARMPIAQHRDGFAVANPVRALADACRLTRDLDRVRDLVTTCLRTSVMRAPDLYRELDEGPRQGSASLRAVLDEYADGVRSVAEAAARQRLLAMPISRPAFNVDLLLPDGSFLARPDAYWADAGLAFEVDSMEHHGDRAGWEGTQRRHLRMTAHGITVVHASPYRIRTDWRTLEEEITAAWRWARTVPTPAITIVEPTVSRAR